MNAAVKTFRTPSYGETTRACSQSDEAVLIAWCYSLISML